MARRYRIVERLGAGAFGEVLRAVPDDAPKRDVALKLLAPGMDGDDVARRLRDEGRMLRLLAHPAIVRVERVARLGETWAVVMEYVPGIDLSRAIAAGGLPPRAALGVVAAVADALDFAWHATDPATGAPLRVVHRDVKPANVRLSPDGAVRVIDFGAARAEFATREARTRSATFGSWDYMAPERFEGADSPAGDVFALALVALELLTGIETRDTPKLERRFLEWLADRTCRIPPAAVTLLERMASFDAGHRPPAAQVRDRARALVAELDGPTLEEWARDRVPLLAAASGPDRSREGEILVEEPGEAAPLARWRRRRVAGLLGLAAAGLALVLATVLPGSSRTLAGPTGRALLLDGRTGHVKVPATPALDLGGSATIEAWARIGGWYRDDLFPVVDRIWRLEVSRRFVTFNNGKGYPSLLSASLALDRWVHIGAAFDAGAATVTWYLDGERVLRERFVQPWVDLEAEPVDLVIGAGPFGAPEFARGALDDVRVWARALPADEIGQPLAGRPGLVAAWTFDEPDGPVRDVSGNGHDGVLVGDAKRVPVDDGP